MNRLFIELYMDEDISVQKVDLLRVRGFSVEKTQEARRVGADDEAQLGYAVGHRRALLTHKRDEFAEDQVIHI